jgi:hypothetical protein
MIAALLKMILLLCFLTFNMHRAEDEAPPPPSRRRSRFDIYRALLPQNRFPDVIFALSLK